VLALLAIGTASAKSVLVRVAARDYPELYDHIPFKGTSINIAGAKPGESYDLVLDESDLALVQNSGLATQVLSADLEGWKRLATDGAYHSYAEHVTKIRNWASLYPTICIIESIGPSYEGRWIYGLKISDNPQVEDTTEPEMLVYGQIHAREWATAEMIDYAIDTLLRNYLSNVRFQDWINNHQLWVFPLLNVDGFSYDYPSQLMWRKNRQPFGGSTGTDMNRDGDGSCQGNPQSEWGALVSGSRTSNNPGDETFCGARGEYAPEVKALTTLFRNHTFLVDVSIHSYSELVLWPWGINTTPPDNSFMTTLGQRAAAQINALGGGTYTPQQSTQLYPTNGGVEDWFYGWARTVGGFPCPSYTFEVGTTFYQPTSNLDVMAPQVFKGIWVMMSHVDSVRNSLKGMVPGPTIAPIETSMDGNYNVHWTPVRPARNAPDKWELEELQNLTVVTDDIEANTNKWVLQGAVSSTTQKHSGTKSLFLGNSSNMSNWAVTKDPYPVTSANDSVKFWVWHNLENNYDIGMCEVSLEGKYWTQLHDRYTGNSSGWVRKAYSLAPWLGKSIFIRFHATSDDGSNSGGMYVDDVYPVPVFATRTTISNNITDTLYAFTGKPTGHYYYRVRGHNTAWNWGDQGFLRDVWVGGSSVSERPAVPVVGPAKTAIAGIAPNPAVGARTISYAVAQAGAVRLSIYDRSGQLVRDLVSAPQVPAQYQVSWDGKDQHGNPVAAGVYVCRLNADRTEVQPIVVLH
jgi:carboxypeptidase T